MLTVTQLLNTADELEKRANAFRLVARELQVDSSYIPSKENNEIVSVENTPKRNKRAKAKVITRTISVSGKNRIAQGQKKYWASLSSRQRALRLNKMIKAKREWLKNHQG